MVPIAMTAVTNQGVKQSCHLAIVETSSSGDVMGKLPPIVPNLLLYF